MDNSAKGPSNLCQLLPFSQCVEAVLLCRLRICCGTGLLRVTDFPGISGWLFVVVACRREVIPAVLVTAFADFSVRCAVERDRFLSER